MHRRLWLLWGSGRRSGWREPASAALRLSRLRLKLRRESLRHYLFTHNSSPVRRGPARFQSPGDEGRERLGMLRELRPDLVLVREALRADKRSKD